MLILDEDFDNLGDSPDAAALHDLFVRSHTVYRCSKCGRLYVRWIRGGEITAYIPLAANAIDASGAEAASNGDGEQ